MAAQQLVIAGDIGGTNSRLQLWNLESSSAALVFEKIYPSTAFNSMHDLLLAFVADAGSPAVVLCAAIGIVGPIVDERFIAHNALRAGPILVNQHPTTWKADARDVEARVPCIGKVVLLNDFVAAGLGVLVLKPEDVVCLSSAAVVDRQPKVYMTWNSATREYDVHASEGGMTTFCAGSDDEWRLRQFVAARSDNFVNIEGVVSGPGLVNTYDWACAEAGVKSAAADPAAIASLAAAGDAQAKRAVAVMVKVFGAGLRNAALHMMSGGGVYIAGGLSVKAGIREEIEASILNHFLADPHMSGVLATFPLFLVLREDLGLSGALERARRAVVSPA